MKIADQRTRAIVHGLLTVILVVLASCERPTSDRFCGFRAFQKLRRANSDNWPVFQFVISSLKAGPVEKPGLQVGTV